MTLEIKDLTKDFGSVRALDNFSMKFESGVYGILGANGAGKSTMINLITDNVKRQSGSILYDGNDILKLSGEFRKIVGYMPQQQGFYEDFSAREFLKYMASMKGIKGREAGKQIENLLEVVNLTHHANKKIGGFSGGMKQRVMLAQALLGDPKILILDEPTAGLDPKERIAIRNYISKLGEDKIILFATHVVSDIECIADKVMLLKKGRLIRIGTPKELIDSMHGKVCEIICTAKEAEEYQEKFTVGNIRQRSAGMALRMVGDNLPEEFVRVNDNIDLEDVYLYYFGKE